MMLTTAGMAPARIGASVAPPSEAGRTDVPEQAFLVRQGKKENRYGDTEKRLDLPHRVIPVPDGPGDCCVTPTMAGWIASAAFLQTPDRNRTSLAPWKISSIFHGGNAPQADSLDLPEGDVPRRGVAG